MAVDHHERDAHLHPELQYTHSRESVDTRESLIATLEAGRIDYQKIPSSEPTTRLFGETGVVAGPVTMSTLFEGRMIEIQSVYTAVYRRTSQGVWRLLSDQSTSSPNSLRSSSTRLNHREIMGCQRAETRQPRTSPHR